MRKKVFYFCYNLIAILFLVSLFIACKNFYEFKLLTKRTNISIEMLEAHNDMPPEVNQEELKTALKILKIYKNIADNTTVAYILIATTGIFLFIYIFLEINYSKSYLYIYFQKINYQFRYKLYFIGYLFFIIGLLLLFNAITLNFWVTIDSSIHLNYSNIFDRSTVDILMDLLKRSHHLSTVLSYVASGAFMFLGLYIIFSKRNKDYFIRK